MSFFKIFKSKTITNKQTLTVGFVLAVVSMLSLGVSVVLLPMFGVWLNVNGVTQLDFFFTAFIFTFLCASQALILFGFPMYYAQDQKSHMTSLRILLCTLMWMLGLMLFVGVVYVQVEKPAAIPTQSFESLDMGVVETPTQ